MQSKNDNASRRLVNYNHDGKKDILLAGNIEQTRIKIGKIDASYGVLLKGNGKGDFTTLAPQESGILVKGAIRDMIKIKKAGKEMFL